VRQPDRPPLRRLALVPPPADGEAFHSRFFRLVEAQHSHRDTIASLLGLPPYTPQRYTLGEDFITIFDGEYVFENLRDATGLRARAMSRRTHHLHLVPTGSPRFVDGLALRDYMRAHRDAAVEYERLKRKLAIRHVNDREAYTEGKTEMVTKLTEVARRWTTTR
jgi:GrpB-like predicted nucleotidyltransferase (UPF0157 family)